MKRKQRILVAPLDWGLGHTTRCMPLIQHLIGQGHTVLLAAEGSAAQLLRERFPQLSILPLKGYRISYARSSATFMLKLLLQLPKMLGAIRREHRWLQRIVADFQIDLVISDNRYGLYHNKVQSVIMTHQLQIISGWGRWVDNILLHMHRKMLNRFDQCWVVDTEASPGLAGALSHPAVRPKHTQYLGWLSQFADITEQQPQQSGHFLVLLSGPEPMRGQLEQILWQQCSALSEYRFTFVAGKPGAKARAQQPAHIQWYAHLQGEALAKELMKASAVICRSGYSTLMDLLILQRPALLIPTPGQTEQEYLAQHIQACKLPFISRKQSELCLKEDLKLLSRIEMMPFIEKSGKEFIEILESWI